MKLTRGELTELLPGPADCDECVERLRAYSAILQKANTIINLVSRHGEIEAEISRQIRRSLLPLSATASLPISRWIDIGSGGGFPAIPIKIARPAIALVMVESVVKKAEFLRKVIRDLDLQDCEVVASRAERYAVEFGASSAAAFDVVSAKAVAPLFRTLEIATLLLRDGGLVVTYRPSSDFTKSLPQDYRDRFRLPSAIPVEAIAALADQDVILLKKHEINRHCVFLLRFRQTGSNLTMPWVRIVRCMSHGS